MTRITPIGWLISLLVLQAGDLAPFQPAVSSCLANEADPPSVDSAKSETPQPPLKQIGPGVFEVGSVRLDKPQRTISFPAVLNMNSNLIEYLIVTTSGKTHESLLRTEAEPYQIHVALLLLGARGAGTNAFPMDPAKPLPGDNVTIDLSWIVDGKTKRVRAEQCVYNRQTQSVVRKGPWVYNGSRLVEGAFIAQQIGSIVSLMEDPDALINNPRPGREKDDIWEIRSKGLPPLNAPVRVTIKLERGP